jgi:DNA polymerase III beta subunit, central domain
MQITFSQNQLKAALECAAKKDIRPHLVGVHVERVASGTVYIVSTDGHKMFVGKLEIEAGLCESLTIPRDKIELVLKSKQSYIVLDSEANTLGGIPFEPLEGRFPDWRRVVPEGKADDEGVAQFDPEYVLQCAKALTYWDNAKEIMASIYHRGANNSGLVKRYSGMAFCVIMPRRDGQISYDLPFTIEPVIGLVKAA